MLFESILVLSVSLFSLFLGSFFAVLIDRSVRDEQFVKGRSYCESCNHTLEGIDHIPLFSFILLRGKCRYCKNPIPKKLLYIELSCGIIFGTLSLKLLNLYTAGSLTTNITILYLLLAIILFIIFWSDALYMLIPDLLLYTIPAIYFIFLLLIKIDLVNLGTQQFAIYGNLGSHLISAIWLFSFFFLLHRLSRGKAMGEGDVYLAPGLGLFLTYDLSIVMWMASFVLGALWGITLIILRKEKMKSQIAFGPFLILGFLISILFGKSILSWYLGLM